VLLKLWLCSWQTSWKESSPAGALKRFFHCLITAFLTAVFAELVLEQGVQDERAVLNNFAGHK
jgi:hypothetical protein